MRFRYSGLTIHVFFFWKSFYKLLYAFLGCVLFPVEFLENNTIILLGFKFEIIHVLEKNTDVTH